MPSKKGGKKVVQKAAPAADKGGSIFHPKKRTFSIGGDIPGKRDLGRFVKWPKYVRLQRQRAVLYKRLKVPPGINQFTQTLDKTNATELFRLLEKYRPEDKSAKKDRLKAEAEAKASGTAYDRGPKPVTVKYGLNHVTALIEAKKASLVVIAHDVDPVEIVVWLPTLCRKMDIPYCIVKGKSRLGAVVHKKTATAVCFEKVNNADQSAFVKLQEAIKSNFNERSDSLRKTWGGGIMGAKTVYKVAQYEKQRAKELAAREGK